MKIIAYWLLECLVCFIFDIPVMLVAWFYSKWHYERKRGNEDHRIVMNDLAKACCKKGFNYYIAVDEDGVLREEYMFTEGSKIDKNFKKMKGIKERKE